MATAVCIHHLCKQGVGTPVHYTAPSQCYFRIYPDTEVVRGCHCCSCSPGFAPPIYSCCTGLISMPASGIGVLRVISYVKTLANDCKQ